MLEYDTFRQPHAAALTEASRILDDALKALYQTEDELSRLRVAIAVHRRAIEKMKAEQPIRACDRELWEALNA